MSDQDVGESENFQLGEFLKELEVELGPPDPVLVAQISKEFFGG